MWLRTLAVMWLALVLSSVFVFSTIPSEGTVSGIPVGILRMLSGASVLILLYTGWRIAVFHQRLVRLLRRIISGDYNVGLRLPRSIPDELNGLEYLLNQMTGQLMEYDELRAERTGLSYRALDMLAQNVSHALIIADCDRKVFRLNNACRKVFGVDQDAFSFDSVFGIDANKGFESFFNDIIQLQKVPSEAPLSIQFPRATSLRKCRVRLLPLEGRAETVKMALIFVEQQGGSH